MAGKAFSVVAPNFKAIAARQAAQFKAAQDRAAKVVVAKVSLEAQRLIREQMAGAGLGRLGGAVKQKVNNGDAGYGPSGIIYAAGGDDSRAGGALDAYSNGVTIAASNRQWLAFQTNVIPRRVGRKRMTPALYVQAGYNTTLGKLQFRPVNSRLALLVVRNTTQHVRTGRIKPAGKRRSKVRTAAAEVVVFILIKVTIRGKRFDKDAACAAALERAPEYIADYLEQAIPAS